MPFLRSKPLRFPLVRTVPGRKKSAQIWMGWAPAALSQGRTWLGSSLLGGHPDSATSQTSGGVPPTLSTPLKMSTFLRPEWLIPLSPPKHNFKMKKGPPSLIFHLHDLIIFFCLFKNTPVWFNGCLFVSAHLLFATVGREL